MEATVHVLAEATDVAVLQVGKNSLRSWCCKPFWMIKTL